MHPGQRRAGASVASRDEPRATAGRLARESAPAPRAPEPAVGDRSDGGRGGVYRLEDPPVTRPGAPVRLQRSGRRSGLRPAGNGLYARIQHRLVLRPVLRRRRGDRCLLRLLPPVARCSGRSVHGQQWARQCSVCRSNRWRGGVGAARAAVSPTANPPLSDNAAGRGRPAGDGSRRLYGSGFGQSRPPARAAQSTRRRPDRWSGDLGTPSRLSSPVGRGGRRAVAGGRRDGNRCWCSRRLSCRGHAGPQPLPELGRGLPAVRNGEPGAVPRAIRLHAGTGQVATDHAGGLAGHPAGSHGVNHHCVS